MKLPLNNMVPPVEVLYWDYTIRGHTYSKLKVGTLKNGQFLTGDGVCVLYGRALYINRYLSLILSQLPQKLHTVHTTNSNSLPVQHANSVHCMVVYMSILLSIFICLTISVDRAEEGHTLI